MVYYVILGVIIFIAIFVRFYMQFKLNKYFDVKTKISGFEACKKVLEGSKKDNVYIVTTNEDIFNYYDISNNAVKLSNETFNSEDIVNVCLSMLLGNEVLLDNKFLNLKHRLFKFINFIIRVCYILIILGLVIGEEQFCFASIVLFIFIFLYQILNFIVINKIVNNGFLKLSKEVDEKEYKEVIKIIKFKELSLMVDSIFNIFVR